jgi:THAP4-like, heme-binding beta-barrel domain
MAFTIPENLHPDLMPLAWIIGTWRGKGKAEYPGMKAINYAQEVSFNHDGQNYLNYFSRTWEIDDDNEIIKPHDSEVGFWRVRDKEVLEVVLSHNSGTNEGWLGLIRGPKIQLAMDKTYESPSAKAIAAGSRLYGLVEGQLFTSLDVEKDGHELQAYMWSSLERQTEN